MDAEYLNSKKKKLLSSTKRGLLLARAKLQNRLIVIVDKDGNTELTYDQPKKGDAGKKCIRLNTGNEPNAIRFAHPISNVIRLLDKGESVKASRELENIFTSLQKTLSPSSTSVQFLKMAKRNLKMLCKLQTKKWLFKDSSAADVDDWSSLEDEPQLMDIE